MVLGRLQAGVELAAMRLDKNLVGSPSSRGILLLGSEQPPGSRHAAQIAFLAENQSGLGGGAEGDGVTIGVAARQDIFAASERIEVFAVEQIGDGAIAEGPVSGQRVGAEEIFGQYIGLVVGRVLFSHAIPASLGNVGNRAAQDSGQQLAGRCDSGQRERVDQAREMLVENVAGPDFFGIYAGVDPVFADQRGGEA